VKHANSAKDNLEKDIKTNKERMKLVDGSLHSLTHSLTRQCVLCVDTLIIIGNGRKEEVEE